MKVLWLCNIALPKIAEALSMPVSNKEGWLAGISETILKENKKDITLGVCFPVSEEQDGISGETDGLFYYGFYEDVLHPENYDEALEARLTRIVEEFKPDVVHAFGTEFPHTLAMMKAFDKPEKMLISVQGICTACAEVYTMGVPEKVSVGMTFRDWLKKDNIKKQQEKFVLRGKNETEALRVARHVAGRTAFDKSVLSTVAADAKYYHWNETLRSNFYGEEWSLADCEKHSIFVSQGNYTIKGLHYVLEALPQILKAYPDAKLYVAGDVITAYETVKDKIKIGTYGKYLRSLIQKNKLQEHVVFLGKQDAVQMCDRYKKSHVFLSASLVENSPNSVGEAMLLGVPVVSSRVGGVESLMADEKEGLFYAVDDTDALAAQVKRIFADDTLAGKLSVAAKKRAACTHDAQANYDRLLEIYHEINLCV